MGTHVYVVKILRDAIVQMKWIPVRIVGAYMENVLINYTDLCVDVMTDGVVRIVPHRYILVLVFLAKIVLAV